MTATDIQPPLPNSQHVWPPLTEGTLSSSAQRSGTDRMLSPKIMGVRILPTFTSRGGA